MAINFGDADTADAQYLHAEILQLRNQQFYLGTLALAGSGLTAFIAPAATAITQGRIPELTLVGASLGWLLLLALLYWWSSALWTLIAVFSKYLELRELSNWEGFYRTMPLKNSIAPSQSWFVALAFTIYGSLVVASSSLAAISAPTNIELGRIGASVLISSLGLFLGFVWFTYFARLKRAAKITKILSRAVQTRNAN